MEIGDSPIPIQLNCHLYLHLCLPSSNNSPFLPSFVNVYRRIVALRATTAFRRLFPHACVLPMRSSMQRECAPSSTFYSDALS